MMQKKISKQLYSKAIENLINKALLLKSQEKYSEGLIIMRTIEKDFPNDSVILGIIASLFYENKDYKKSEEYFRKTVDLNPDSELASLGLYHSLIFLNKVDEALLELSKFINQHSPKLYRITIDELRGNVNEFNEQQKETLNKIFSLQKMSPLHGASVFHSPKLQLNNFATVSSPNLYFLLICFGVFLFYYLGTSEKFSPHVDEVKSISYTFSVLI